MDTDCVALPEGRCLTIPGVSAPCGPGQPSTVCVYGCTVDEDCGDGQICVCGVPTGRCVAAGCTTNADCDGLYCASNGSPDTLTAFTCQTPRDTCMIDADCPASTQPYTRASCAPAEERTCATVPGTGGSCGRPFLVAGEARLAPACDTPGGWTRPSALDATALSVNERRQLAEHWTEMGRMEHASVAAFARFTLDLLSLGAPAELVVASQRALSDEIEHARLCFGLASAYAGRSVGPGALAMDGALDERSFETIVTTAIREACVGETLAALEAEAELAEASDPEVRRVLERIAADEARHAELGFRFLRWALDRAAPALRARFVAELRTAVEVELERKVGGARLLWEILGPAVRGLDAEVRLSA
jgi:hypothetical protein